MVDELQTKNQQSMHDMLDSTFIAQKNQNAIAYVKNQATQNANDILVLQSDVKNLKEGTTTQAKTIEELCEFKATTSKNIDNLEKNISSNKSDICNIQSSLIDAKDAIAQNTKDIEKAKTKIDKNAENIQLLFDNKTSTGQSLETIAKKVDTNTAEITTLKTDVQTNKTEISSLQTDLQTAQTYIEINSQNISTNAQNIEDNAKLIDDISKQQTANTTNISALTTSVSNLQTQQQTSAQNIENNSQQISQLQNAKSDILVNITSLQKDVENNNKNILQNQTDIATNTTDISTLKTNAKANATDIATLKTSKQDALTAGANITISPENVISASGGSLTAGANISISDGVISCTAPTYTAGTNITIDQDNKISATSKTYTAGQNIDIDNADVISCTAPTYSAGANIQISDDNIISAQAVAYTAGQNIEITDDGVISSTAGSGLTQQQVEQIDSNTSGILALQNSVQQNTADIANLKNISTDTGTFDLSSLSQNVQTNTTDIETLKQQMAKVYTPADPSYQPKTYTDYPAGTIVKTYDCYDREVYFKLSSKITLPTIYFCAEPEGEATIKLSINMYVDRAGTTCTISAYLNGTKIDDEFVDITQKNKSISFTKTYYQQALNTQAKGNNFYVILQTTGVSYNYPIIINNYKVEFEAPNADIINKILPFNVEYFDGIYYFSDCTTGVAKTAQIDAELLHNIKNLSWVDTGIPAQKYYHVPSIIYGGDVYKIDTINYLILQKNASSLFTSQKYNYTYTDYNSLQFLPKQTLSPRVYFWMVQPTQICNKSLDLSAKLSYTSIEASLPFIKYIPPKCITYPHDGMVQTAIRIDKDGIISALGGGKSINICYGTDAIIYQNKYISTNEAQYSIIVKQFNKIIRFELSRTTSNGLQITNSTVLGAYEQLYLGANNDYFAVKNSTLEYHKF